MLNFPLHRPSLIAFLVMGFTATAMVAQSGTLQDIANAAAASQPQIVIYPAKEIVTLDPEKPTAQAVAVLGDRILKVGSLDELKAAAGSQPYSVNNSFVDLVVVPGFIAQHDHPMLAGLTMTSEIIAIEDWVLSPQFTSPAAKDHKDYLERLSTAEAALDDPDELLLTWGFHSDMPMAPGKPLFLM